MANVVLFGSARALTGCRRGALGLVDFLTVRAPRASSQIGQGLRRILCFIAVLAAYRTVTAVHVRGVICND